MTLLPPPGSPWNFNALENRKSADDERLDGSQLYLKATILFWSDHLLESFSQMQKD